MWLSIIKIILDKIMTFFLLYLAYFFFVDCFHFLFLQPFLQETKKKDIKDNYALDEPLL